MVSHLLDPTPTEIHVFSSLASGYPVAVSTTKNGKMWLASGSGIALLPSK
jgi:streptogramin lyase